MIVSDLREELVAYVSGQPYLRRELEMPSAALHHAGEIRKHPPDCLVRNCLHGLWDAVRLTGLQTLRGKTARNPLLRKCCHPFELLLSLTR